MDLIVTSGGLGPTADDLTAEVVGRFAGREMVLDEEMERKIAAILRAFAKRWRRFDTEAIVAANRKQAMVPEGSIALDPEGTAPGLVVPAGEVVVIVLPGPPRELQPMWPAAIETEPVQEVLARATPLQRLHDADVRGSRVRDRPQPASRSSPTASSSTRSRSPPACGAGEIEIDVRWREEAERRRPRRSGRA